MNGFLHKRGLSESARCVCVERSARIGYMYWLSGDCMLTSVRLGCLSIAMECGCNCSYRTQGYV